MFLIGTRSRLVKPAGYGYRRELKLHDLTITTSSALPIRRLPTLPSIAITPPRLSFWKIVGNCRKSIWTLANVTRRQLRPRFVPTARTPRTPRQLDAGLVLSFSVRSRLKLGGLRVLAVSFLSRCDLPAW